MTSGHRIKEKRDRRVKILGSSQWPLLFSVDETHSLNYMLKTMGVDVVF